MQNPSSRLGLLATLSVACSPTGAGCGEMEIPFSKADIPDNLDAICSSYRRGLVDPSTLEFIDDDPDEQGTFTMTDLNIDEDGFSADVSVSGDWEHNYLWLDIPIDIEYVGGFVLQMSSTSSPFFYDRGGLTTVIVPDTDLNMFKVDEATAAGHGNGTVEIDFFPGAELNFSLRKEATLPGGFTAYGFGLPEERIVQMGFAANQYEEACDHYVRNLEFAEQPKD